MSNNKDVQPDIDPFKDSLQKIKSLHVLYQILNSNDIGFLVTDETGAIVYCNSPLFKMLSIKFEHIFSKNILKFLEYLEQNNLNNESNITQIKHLYNNLEDSYSSILNCKGNKFLKFSSFPYPDTKHPLRIWTFSDITEKIGEGITLKVDNQTLDSLKSIYEEKIDELLEENKLLEKHKDELSKDKHAKEIFISIIAHDLKSPFQGLLGIFDIISESLDDIPPDEIKKYLNYAKSSVKNLYVLIEELLEWSRLYLGQVKLTPTRCNLAFEMLNVIELNKNLIEDKKITVINYLKDKIEAFVDENMVNSIFRNLISNAVKFSKRGGSIIIKSYLHEDHIEITVTDQGVGMSKDTQDKLFKIDKFFSTRGTEDEEGSGLGLLLCKEMLALHGGNIWFESELGKGSTFHITLPLNKE